MFFFTESSKDLIDTNIDQYGDSFARDTTINELREIFDAMPNKFETIFNLDEFRKQLDEEQHDLGELRGWMYWGMLLYVDPLAEDFRPTLKKQSFKTMGLRMKLASSTARFAGAQITSDLNDKDITHIVVGDNRDRPRKLRQEISS